MEAKIRVLIVDDSAFARFVISRQLETSADISVAGHARDGFEAIEKVRELQPDVITLDIEMPRLDGLSALKQIMLEHPTPVVMLSTLTGKGTEATIKALELGAVDFFLKASTTNPTGSQGVNELIDKIKTASKVKLTRLKTPEIPGKPARAKAGTPGRRAEEVMVIGSSTGGPRALYQIVPALPAYVPAAFLFVQHMPAGFTKSLADRLNQLTELEFKEAKSGDVLYAGNAYMAPGGYHMVMNKKGVIDLNQAPQVCGVRPSIDVTMASAVAVYGQAVTGVVLTGMGADGTQGTTLIKQAGGYVIAEDASTCTIYGMPKSVIEAGNADAVLPLHEIPTGLAKLYENRTRE